MFEPFLKYIADLKDVIVKPVKSHTASADIEKKTIFIPENLPSEFSYIIVTLLLHEGSHIKYSEKLPEECAKIVSDTTTELLLDIDIRKHLIPHLKYFIERWEKKHNEKLNFDILTYKRVFDNITSFFDYNLPEFQHSICNIIEDIKVDAIAFKLHKYIEWFYYLLSRKTFPSYKKKIAQQEDLLKGLNIEDTVNMRKDDLVRYLFIVLDSLLTQLKLLIVYAKKDEPHFKNYFKNFELLYNKELDRLGFFTKKDFEELIDFFSEIHNKIKSYDTRSDLFFFEYTTTDFYNKCIRKMIELLFNPQLFEFLAVAIPEKIALDKTTEPLFFTMEDVFIVSEILQARMTRFRSFPEITEAFKKEFFPSGILLSVEDVYTGEIEADKDWEYGDLIDPYIYYYSDVKYKLNFLFRVAWKLARASFIMALPSKAIDALTRARSSEVNKFIYAIGSNFFSLPPREEESIKKLNTRSFMMIKYIIACIVLDIIQKYNKKQWYKLYNQKKEVSDFYIEKLNKYIEKIEHKELEAKITDMAVESTLFCRIGKNVDEIAKKLIKNMRYVADVFIGKKDYVKAVERFKNKVDTMKNIINIGGS